MITEIYSNGRRGLGNLKKGIRMDRIIWKEIVFATELSNHPIRETIIEKIWL